MTTNLEETAKYISNDIIRELVYDIQSDVAEFEKVCHINRFLISDTRNMMVDTIVSLTNLITPISNLIKHLNHSHYAHLHGCCHKYYPFGLLDGDLDVNSCLFTPRTQGRSCPLYEQLETYDLHELSNSQKLVMEMDLDKDLDGNNMIYGKDFIISPNDTEQPLQIKLLTAQLDNNLSIPMINWNNYLSNL